MMLLSPITIGPASAIIDALGLTVVLLPIEILPLSLDSTKTIAPGDIVTLKQERKLK
jgi:hypothetical protein